MGCDSLYWRNILLRYSSSSAGLRGSFAALSCPLCNSLVPLDDVRALVASCLIVLNKCAGVHPVGIREICRIIGKAVCSATCWGVLYVDAVNAFYHTAKL